MTDVIAEGWGRATRNLAANPHAAKTFLIDGRAPSAGEVFRNPDLASSLHLIAEKGAAGFYEGKTAEAILALSRQEGGTLTAADLKEYAPEWVEPISTTYRSWTVYELPPNTQGIAALMMLNLMERFPLGEYGFHIMGGFNQAHAHAQFVANLADYGMDIQEALEAGRFTKGSFQGCDVSIEALVHAAGIRRALSRAVRCGVFPRAFRSDLPVWLQGKRRGARARAMDAGCCIASPYQRIIVSCARR